MSKENTGGPAFPETGLSGLPNGEFILGQPGMTLRDYFAAKAPFTLAEAVAAADLESQAPSIEVAAARVLLDPAKRAKAMAMLAALRSEYADAMLKARAVPAPESDLLAAAKRVYAESMAFDLTVGALEDLSAAIDKAEQS